jgi:hypothetical protein
MGIKWLRRLQGGLRANESGKLYRASSDNRMLPEVGAVLVRGHDE